MSGVRSVQALCYAHIARTQQTAPHDRCTRPSLKVIYTLDSASQLSGRGPTVLTALQAIPYGTGT